MLARTATPPKLFGAFMSDEGIGVTSGESLRRQSIPAYLKSRHLQTRFTAAVKGCLAALGIDAEVEWPEPLEQIDNDTRSGGMPGNAQPFKAKT